MTGQAFRDELAAAVEGAVLFDEPLDRHTSLRVGGRADVLVSPRSVEALRRVITHCRSGGVLRLKPAGEVGAVRTGRWKA